ELRLDRPQVNMRHTRRLAVEDLRVCRVAELRIGSRGRSLGERLLACPWLIGDVVFIPPLRAADVGDAQALTDAAASAIRRPVAREVRRLRTCGRIRWRGATRGRLRTDHKRERHNAQ